MKFTLFALVAAFCLLSVHANFVEVEPYEDNASPLHVAEFEENGDAEFDVFVLNTVWRVLSGALRVTKGLNCMIQWVVGIKTSAINFNNGVVNCGQALGQQAQAMVDANVAIISTCNDLINLKTKVCANIDDDDDSTDSLAESCSFKVLATIWQLKNQVLNVVNMAKNVPKTGVASGQCVAGKATTLAAYYTQLPKFLQKCSQLTSS